MAFKIANSNKPKPEPSAPLFVKRVLPNGRTIWLSLPQLDKLTLTVPITKNLYGIGVSTDTPVADYANSLGAFFKEQEVAACDVRFIPGGWLKALLKVGPEKSTVLIEHKRKGLNHTLRLDCNPRKLGQAGFAQLIAILGNAEGKFSRTEIVSHGKVTRLDLAIDAVRMHVSEIVLHHDKQGKRTLYVARDGSLESVYVHRQRPAPKSTLDGDGNPIPAKLRTTAPLVRTYDLVRRELDHGLPRPYGLADATRIEVVTRPLKMLGALQTMTNPYLRFRAGYVGSQGIEVVAFSAYQTARRTSRRDQARGLLGLTSNPDDFDAAEPVAVPDLVDLTSWIGFSEAIELCGLKNFLNPAECN